MTPYQEARLINRAIVKRWDISPDEMKNTIDRVVHLRDYAEDEKTQMAAVRAIVSMVGQNQKDEHKVIDVRVTTRHDQLAGIAADLGIEVGAIEDAARKADCGIGSPEDASVPVERDERT